MGSGGSETLKLIFRKGPLTPIQTKRFLAPDNVGLLSSVGGTQGRSALPSRTVF